MKKALAIGCMTVALMIFVRGGTDDFLVVASVLMLIGIAASFFFGWLLRTNTLLSIERFAGYVPSLFRDLFALVTAMSFLFWSGPLIRSFDYGGWVMAILFWIAGPLVVGLIAPRWSIALGIVTVSCIEASVFLGHARFRIEHGDKLFWSHFWEKSEFTTLMAAWVVAVSLSLIVSIPISLSRRQVKLA